MRMSFSPGFQIHTAAAFDKKQVTMPRVGRGRGEEEGGGKSKQVTYLRYLEQRSMGRLRRGAGDRINRNLALDMLNPPPRSSISVKLVQLGLENHFYKLMP